MIKYVKCAILFIILPSIAMAQEATTKPRFIGVWLSNPAEHWCRKVLEIDMVSDTHADLEFGRFASNGKNECP